VLVQAVGPASVPEIIAPELIPPFRDILEIKKDKVVTTLGKKRHRGTGDGLAKNSCERFTNQRRKERKPLLLHSKALPPALLDSGGDDAIIP
jgi:hypothetical protein